MTAKLTLSIDDKVIERAKTMSQKAGKSLSKIVEEYLVSLSAHDPGESIVDEIPRRLRGKNKLPIPKDYKEFVRNARFEDYMNGEKK